MAKDENNLYKHALRNGARECNGEDLLTECKNLLAALGIPDVRRDERILTQTDKKKQVVRQM